MVKPKGFTLIEILIVMSILSLLFTVGLPISYRLYQSYQASLKAEEVMVFMATLKRDSFLYSEAKVVLARDGILFVNGIEKVLQDTLIQIDQPIEFYKNGTTSGGIIKIVVGDQAYSLNLQAPFGTLILERKG